MQVKYLLISFTFESASKFIHIRDSADLICFFSSNRLIFSLTLPIKLLSRLEEYGIPIINPM